MPTVTVSPKYQIVIPLEIRDSMGIQPGEKLEVFEINGRIEIVPVLPIEKMRGIAPGIDTHVQRDKDRV